MKLQFVLVLDAKLSSHNSVVIGSAQEKAVQDKAAAEKRQAAQGAQGKFNLKFNSACLLFSSDELLMADSFLNRKKEDERYSFTSTSRRRCFIGC